MPFIQKHVGAEQSFGADLKELRELRGWSVQELARATNVNSSLILILEQERFSELQDPYYVERHVRVLVGALDGRVPYMLDKYRQALSAQNTAESTRQSRSFLRRIRRFELFVPTRYASFLIILPVMFVLGWYVWHQTQGLTAAPYLELTEPSDF